MSLYLSDSEKFRIEFFINKCSSHCEPAVLLHRLYTAFILVDKELKRLDYELWEKISINDKSYMGTQQLPKVSDGTEQDTKESDD